MKHRLRLLLMLTLVLTLLPVSPAARAEAPEVISCFINHAWYPVTSFTGLIPEEITRLSGVQLNIAIAKDQRQLNQMIAQGTLPDIVFTSTQLDRLSDPQLCYSYDELIRRYGLDWKIPADLRANALVYSSDGELYTLLNNYASDEDWRSTRSVPMTSTLLVRQDLLDEMGVESIRNTDELYDVFLRVHEEYPDMVPLTFDAVHRFNVFRCFFGFGLLPFLEQEDGTQLFYARDSRYEEMLVWLNGLYREGCITVDNFAAVSADSSTLYKQGCAFAHSHCTQNGNQAAAIALRQLNPAYRSVELYPLEGSSYDTQGVGWSGAFITRNARDPEACIRFIQWCFTPEAQRLTEWGRAEIDYTLQENGLPVFSEDVRRSIADGTYNDRYNPWFYFGTSAIIESEGRCALLGENLCQDTYDAIRETYHIFPWMTAALPKSSTPLGSVYEHILSVIDNYETKIILSTDDAAFQQNYREMMTYLDAMDIAALEAYMTENVPLEYARYQTRMKGADEP